MSNDFLNTGHVNTLLNDTSANSRVDTVRKISLSIEGGALNERELKLAQDIFRIMVNDAEVRVREALTANLKESPHLPRDVANILIRDIDTVALPVLKLSDVLTDNDLADIIRTQDETRQIAIAERQHLSEDISDALIETNNETVVSTVVSNEGAAISESSFTKAVERLGDSEQVQNAMVNRSKLPIKVAEKLLTRVSDALRDQILKRHDLSRDVAADLLLQSRERATVLLSTESDEQDVGYLIHQLHIHGRLTVSIVLRALCMGDIRFFEAALAELSDIPLLNARTLIHDPGQTGLKRLWESAKMPGEQLPAALAAISAIAELEYDGEAGDRERFSKRLIELVLTQYGELGVEFESDDLEYLLNKLGQMTAPSGALFSEERRAPP